MKFTLMKTASYWWPVTVRIPSQTKPGVWDEQKLKLHFVAQTRDDAVAAQAKYEKMRSISDRAAHESAQLADRVIGWEDVLDEDGAPIPFSADVFDQAMQHSWFRTAVARAYSDSQIGDAARLGN